MRLQYGSDHVGHITMKLMHSDTVPPEIFNQQRPLSLSLSVIFSYDLVFLFPLKFQLKRSEKLLY